MTQSLTFEKQGLSLTLTVEGQLSSGPEEGESYQVKYFFNGDLVEESEWLPDYCEDEVLDSLEDLAEDWFQSEIERQERSFNR